jgi:uncharacterized protein (DUF697 family)
MKIKRTSKSKERSVPTKWPKRKQITTKKAAKAEIDVGGLAAVAGQGGGKNRVERGKEGEGKWVGAVIAGANEVTRNDQPIVQETIGPEDSEIRSSTEVPINPAANAIEKTDRTRDQHASELVDRLSLWSGAAGFIPVPIVDIAAVWGVQLHMLRRLSEFYGVPFSENRGKSILTNLAGAVIPATTATAAGSVMKSVPIIGTAIGALTMPVVAAGAT